jgi:hypothetical protein
MREDIIDSHDAALSRRLLKRGSTTATNISS